MIPIRSVYILLYILVNYSSVLLSLKYKYWYLSSQYKWEDNSLKVCILVYNEFYAVFLQRRGNTLFSSEFTTEKSYTCTNYSLLQLFQRFGLNCRNIWLYWVYKEHACVHCLSSLLNQRVDAMRYTPKGYEQLSPFATCAYNC